jgi:uncharacterized protein
VKNPLLVNALELLRRPGSVKQFSLEADPASIDLDTPATSLTGTATTGIVPGSTIDVDLTVESLTDGLVVNGSVRAAFRGQCRRCLSPLEGFIDVEVHELYQLQVTDPDAFPIVGDQIDLVPMVRETVLLELPDAPVCRPDCAGLCPQCGIDRNVDSCACTTESIDPRWAVLEGLRDNLPE